MSLGTRAGQLERVVGKYLKIMEDRAGACGLDVGVRMGRQWGLRDELGRLGDCELDMGVTAGTVN